MGGCAHSYLQSSPPLSLSLSSPSPGSAQGWQRRGSQGWAWPPSEGAAHSHPSPRAHSMPPLPPQTGLHFPGASRGGSVLTEVRRDPGPRPLFLWVLWVLWVWQTTGSSKHADPAKEKLSPGVRGKDPCAGSGVLGPQDQGWGRRRPLLSLPQGSATCLTLSKVLPAHSALAPARHHFLWGPPLPSKG